MQSPVLHSGHICTGCTLMITAQMLMSDAPVPTACSWSTFSWAIKNPTVPCMQQRCTAPQHCLSGMPASVLFKGKQVYFIFKQYWTMYWMVSALPGIMLHFRVVFSMGQLWGRNSLQWVYLREHFLPQCPVPDRLGGCCFPWLYTAQIEVHSSFQPWAGVQKLY